METIKLKIHVPKDVGVILEEKAKKHGQDIVEYVEDLVAKQASRPTWRELFADVRANINLSDEDLEKEIDAAIAESRQMRRERG
jgi:predicted Zn-dependent peptidase